MLVVLLGNGTGSDRYLPAAAAAEAVGFAEQLAWADGGTADRPNHKQQDTWLRTGSIRYEHWRIVPPKAPPITTIYYTECRGQGLDQTSHQCNAAFQCKLAEEDPKQDSELRDEEVDEERWREWREGPYKRHNIIQNRQTEALCKVLLEPVGGASP